MKNIETVKAFLFDFDGTLVDTMGGYADIAAKLISSRFPDIPFDKARMLYLETSGIPFFQQLEIILPGHEANGELAAEFEKEKQQGLFAADFSDDARQTIEELRKKGCLAGISSNNFQEMVDMFVADHEVEFDTIMGFAPGFEKGKEHFDKFFNEFNLLPGELVFVGDSLKDAEKAMTNNINFIGLTGTFSSEDFKRVIPGVEVIDSLRELLKI